MNKHIELVKKWLADKDSVSQEELIANADSANADAVAIRNLNTSPCYCFPQKKALADAAAYVARDAAAGAAYAAADAAADAANAARWVKEYEGLSDE